MAQWLATACVGLLALQPVLASPLPPGIPSASTAKSELASLTVSDQGSSSGYSRDEFKTWDSQGKYVVPTSEGSSLTS